MRSWVGKSFLVVVLIGITVVWCVWPAPAPRAIVAAEPRRQASAVPDMQMVDMHLTAQLGGKTVLQVTAKRALSPGVKQRAIVHEIQAKMQQEAGQTWNISAARGLVDRVTGDMTALGGVRLYEKDGYAIETETLSLHTAERVLQTAASVMMHGNAVYIAGTGLRHEIGKNRITLQHQVKALFLYGKERQESKDNMPLDAFAGEHRGRSFEYGARRAEPTADTVSGH
jgi:LPS export ABC transporter protein LptC